jgi:hypothetical protein
MTDIMKALASLAADLAPLRQRNTKTVRVLLVSTYELGRQPFGLASPAACLRADGHQVTCTDLAVEKLSLDTVRNADLIAIRRVIAVSLRPRSSCAGAASKSSSSIRASPMLRSRCARLIDVYCVHRQPQEHFGDFSHRIGVARLHELAESQNGDREGILRTLSWSPTDEEMEEEAHALYREGLPARVEAL